MDDIDEEPRVVRPRRQERLDEAADRRRQTILWSSLAAVVVIAAVVAVVLSRGGGDGDEVVAADRDRASTSVPELDDSDTSIDSSTREENATSTEPIATTASTQPPATDPPLTEPSEPPATEPPIGPVTGTVARTCGPNGKAKCVVVIRSDPSSSSDAIGDGLREGATAEFDCTVMGEEVTSSVLGRPTSVWARNPNGHYVSMAFLDVPGWDTFTTTRPCA